MSFLATTKVQRQCPELREHDQSNPCDINYMLSRIKFRQHARNKSLWSYSIAANGTPGPFFSTKEQVCLHIRENLSNWEMEVLLVK
jgi:hypothetical protein